jgi:hypothetical protein
MLKRGWIILLVLLFSSNLWAQDATEEAEAPLTT